MSVGLDALNKLQRERAERAGDGAIVGMTMVPHAKSGTNGLLAAGFVLSLGLASFALFRSRSSAVAAPQGQPEPTAAGAASEVQFAPSAPAPASAATANPITFSLEPTAAQGSAPRLSSSPSAPNPLVTSFVAAGRLGGVELGNTPGHGPVVMFNDSLYHLNDTVNPVLGVRLVRITPHFLVFQDAQGMLYEKQVPPP